MNRRGFLIGSSALAASSIIGISGVIQLGRPALIVPAAAFSRLVSVYPMSPISFVDFDAWVRRYAEVTGASDMLIGSKV